MRIFITGALGHIGSKLIRDESLLSLGNQVVMIDNMMTQRYCSLFNLPGIGKYNFVEADVNYWDMEEQLCKGDVVIHLAAITDAASSFEKSEELERNNLDSTKRIAEACCLVGAKLISISSTSVYGAQDQLVDENCSRDSLVPQSPYAETKLLEEEYVRGLIATKSLQACILRFGTIYGASPGMRFHTAVNKFCWQAAMRSPITVWKTAYNQKRPYLDLKDCCRAIVHVIKNDLFNGEIYNVLTKNLTVHEVVENIKQFIPDLSIEFVSSKIMNQLSYEVSNKKFIKTGFNFTSDISKSLEEEISLIKIY